MHTCTHTRLSPDIIGGVRHGGFFVCRYRAQAPPSAWYFEPGWFRIEATAPRARSWERAHTPPFRGIVALMAPGSLFLVRHSFFDGLVMPFPPGPISIGARYRSIGPFSFSFPCCRRCGERADGRCGRTRFELLHTILRSFTDLPQTVAALGQSRSELSVCWIWVLEVTA